MKRFKNILCVVNSNVESNPALQRAVGLAENNQASLTVVDVAPRIAVDIALPDGGTISTEVQNTLLNNHRQSLKKLIETYSTRVNIEAIVLNGTPFLEIIREVLRHKHDLVITTPETPRWINRLFGSDDMHLLRKCPCPVWVVKSDSAKTYRRILAAVDVSDAYPPNELEARHELNRQIIQIASSLAISKFSELHIAHAWEPIGEGTMRGTFIQMSEEKIKSYTEEMRQRHAFNLNTLVTDITNTLGQSTLDYLKPNIHLIKGWARKEIPALAKRIDAELIVMGTVGRTGIPGFIIGNTAETILNQIDCSVLAIKPPGFITPVTLED